VLPQLGVGQLGRIFYRLPRWVEPVGMLDLVPMMPTMAAPAVTTTRTFNESFVDRVIHGRSSA
jgi:hypothetical protein